MFESKSYLQSKYIDTFDFDYYGDRFAASQSENRLNLHIVDTVAWRWLLGRIIPKIISYSPEPILMDVIAETVHTQLSLWDSVEGTSLSYDVTFEAAWDPIAFIKNQGYDDSPQEAIARAITLTGTATEVRAIQAARYTEEMWPFSGQSVMKLLQVVVSGRPDLPSCEYLIY